MNRYEKCLEYIESLGSLDSILGLERIKKVLIYFDNPQDKLNIVHIAGTNGKGSTTMMLSNIYIKAGYNVGSYISPYVVDFRERIQYNCDFISKEDLCDLVDEIKHVIYNNNLKLTHFEFITVIAFIYFKNKNCDLVFLEVGLGGRLDATNVILKPLVSVITKIDYDHVDILGHDLVSIAKEKCGIIKN
ncbi:MAG: Mur ligase family protein, partial [Clostridia bacterium]